MTSDQMSREVEKFLNQANDLQWIKNRDYHPDKIAYLEIMRTAQECRITVEQELWARIRKQYVALRRYVLDSQVESEPPRSRMLDIAVYLGMLAVWDMEKFRIAGEALDFMRNVPCERPPSCGECDRCLFYDWLQDYVDQATT